MKTIIFLIVLFLYSAFYAQTVDQFNQSKSKVDQKLMLTLGSWSLANTAVGIYGWSKTEDESKYFHQMNVMWSGVNLALAIPGYFRARKEYAQNKDFPQLYFAQTKTEKIFLFNTALDVAYITGGFLFKTHANNSTENFNRFQGFGNSLILQGSFLFLFDLTALLIHSSRRTKALDPVLERVKLSFTGSQLGFSYQF